LSIFVLEAISFYPPIYTTLSPHEVVFRPSQTQ